VAGRVDWERPGVRVPLGDRADLVPDDRDSAWGVPKGVVIDPAFDWGDDRHPRTPWSETVIYEVHVKGATACGTRTCRRSCGAPTRAWPLPRSSST
jgi:isoamylase